MALIAPILLLLLGGVADLGRAFYFVVAAENTAREAGHFAILPDRQTQSPPSDDQLAVDVTVPSQESFGLNLALAPICSAGAQSEPCLSTAIRHAQPPVTRALVRTTPMDSPLQPNKSWLFVYPDLNRRTAMQPGAGASVAWREIRHTSGVIQAPDPAHGGLAQVLGEVARQLGPTAAYAASSTCDTWVSPTFNQSSFTVDPGSTISVTASVQVTAANGPPDNNILMTATPQSPYSGSFSQFWNPPNGNDETHALLTLFQQPAGTKFTESADATMSIDPATPPGTYTIQVSANSTGGSCVTTKQGNITVTVNPVAPPPPGTVPSDFSISENPTIIGMWPGQTASTQVTATPSGSWTGDVTVTTSWAPPPTGASYSTSPTTPLVITGGNGSGTITFSTTSSTPPGTYPVTVTGTSGATSHLTQLTLNVFGGPPSPTPASGGPGPKGHQITATVVYYFTPITPGLGLFSSGDVIYIFGSATLEATY